VAISYNDGDDVSKDEVVLEGNGGGGGEDGDVDGVVVS
jgi:hypothetical protein